MFRRVAKVLEVKGAQATLSLSRPKACGCCSSMFCGLRGQDRLTLDNSLNSLKGDMVELGLDSKVAVLLSLIIFFTPCLIFIGGIYWFRNLGPALSFSVSILVMIFYFIMVKFTVVDRFKDKFSCRIVTTETRKNI